MELPEGVDPDFLEELLAVLSSTGASWAEVFLQDSRTAHVERTPDGAEAREDADRGAGLTVEIGGRSLFRSVPGLDPDTLRAQALELARSAASGAAKSVPRVEPSAPRFVSAGRTGPEPPLSGKEALVLETWEAACAEAGIRSASVLLKDASSKVAVANSDGLLTSETQNSLTLYVQARAVEGSRSGAASRVISASGGLGGLDAEAHRRLAAKAAESARFALGAGPVPEGEIPVVCSPFAAGQLLHEGVGHLLEADTVALGLSPFADRSNPPPLSPCLNLEDDGAVPSLRGSADYDDEGWPTGRAPLLREGRLAGLLTHRASARALRLPRTGHARRESFRNPSAARMRNLLLLPGTRSQEELLEGIPFGLFAVRVGGGQADLAAGTFAFLLTQGYLIREGRLAEPVGGAVLGGRCADLLLGIEEVACDPQTHAGVCERDGQGVGVSDTSPAIHVRRLSVRRRTP